ncbi:MAG: hypothetical protein COB02_14375 [Candidatus Cloacimonadota bacterium]|nr:MAG: hypothetical protein COB02_14375 [Candidatus Cloacimonadota bacterium]
MSHSYLVELKVRVRETIKVNEEWKSLVEVLPILPQVEMAQLLSQELEKENDWSKKGTIHSKKDGNWSMDYDEESMLLSIVFDEEKTFEKEEVRHVNVYNPGYDNDDRYTEIERKKIRTKMSQNHVDMTDYKKETEQKLSDETEPKLNEIDDLFQTLVEKVQIKALKSKAKNIGEIESITEDQSSGEIKIVINI